MSFFGLVTYLWSDKRIRRVVESILNTIHDNSLASFLLDTTIFLIDDDHNKSYWIIYLEKQTNIVDFGVTGDVIGRIHGHVFLLFFVIGFAERNSRII